MTEPDIIPCSRCGENIENLLFAIVLPPLFAVHDTCAERYADGQVDFDATRLLIRDQGGAA